MRWYFMSEVNGDYEIVLQDMNKLTRRDDAERRAQSAAETRERGAEYSS